MFRGIFGGSQVAAVVPEEAKAKQAAGALVIDVREPSEWRAGHIAGATLISLGTLAQRMHELPRDREIVVVCQSGARSASASRALQAAGFTRVYNLSGGMLAWSRQKLPVAR